MTLGKAIEHGKERRKEYHRSASVDRTCRPGGSCPYCQGNRTYQDRRERQAAADAVREWKAGDQP